VNGHYRLHDLGSTNLTCVEGQPVTDFHLHDACKVSFGTVECDFSPDTPVSTVEKSEVVPTRAELEFLRRENLDLQAKISAMQKQIDILSSARLITKETQNLGVMPEVHKRVQQERDELRNKNAKLELDSDHLRADLAALAKERDALRLAWETVKRERDEAVFRNGHEAKPSGASSATSVAAAAVPESSIASDATRHAPDHRVMATVLTTAPGCVKAMQNALQILGGDSTDDAAAADLAAKAEALLQSLMPLPRHPAQRLAKASVALIRDSRTRNGRIEPSAVGALQQATDTIASLLEPRAFKKASESETPRTLIVDDEQAAVDTLQSALAGSDFRPVCCTTSEQAQDLLRREAFDVVLMDIALPGSNGFDVCAKLRESATNARTPVIFVTGEDSVENRAQSSVQGDDFIAKPLNTLEVVVKASTWACRHQLGLTK
jgi:CheY-like chemotaxis protein